MQAYELQAKVRINLPCCYVAETATKIKVLVACGVTVWLLCGAVRFVIQMDRQDEISRGRRTPSSAAFMAPRKRQCHLRRADRFNSKSKTAVHCFIIL